MWRLQVHEAHASDFMDEETEAQKGLGTCPRSHSKMRSWMWMCLIWTPFNYVRILEPQVMDPSLNLGCLSWSYWWPLIFPYRSIIKCMILHSDFSKEMNVLMGNIKVSLGYITKYYRLGSLNNRNLFLTVLKVSFRWVGVLWGLSPWVGDGYLFAISSHGLFLVHVAAGPGELSPFSRVQLFATLWIVAHQAPLSLGSSRQEYWSGLPCPPPGDLPDPGIEPVPLIFPAFGRWVLYHWHHLGNPAGW